MNEVGSVETDSNVKLSKCGTSQELLLCPVLAFISVVHGSCQHALCPGWFGNQSRPEVKCLCHLLKTAYLAKVSSSLFGF